MSEKATTWGDCPNPECPQYGRMQYSIAPGDTCDDSEAHRRFGCGATLRWYDRWHDGKHRGKQIAECEAERGQ